MACRLLTHVLPLGKGVALLCFPPFVLGRLLAFLFRADKLLRNLRFKKTRVTLLPPLHYDLVCNQDLSLVISVEGQCSRQ